MPGPFTFELLHVTKHADGVAALDDINMSVERGKIHGVLGENGAGKSMIIKLLSGVQRPTSGEILFNGVPVDFKSPLDAINAGIGSVFQEDNFAENLTVAETMLLSSYSKLKCTSVLNWSSAFEATQQTLDKLRAPFCSKQKICELNFGMRQMVKFAGILHMSSEFSAILLDEPYNTCSHGDIQNLETVLKELRDSGMTILLVSHHIDKVITLCDTVTFMKKAGIYATLTTAGLNHEMALELMCKSKPAKSIYPKLRSNTGRVVLELSNVCTSKIDGVSFSLKRGEILGVSGPLGSGRTGIARAISGLDRITGGTIKLHGSPIKIRSIVDAYHAKIGILIDSREDAIEMEMTLPPNITMADFSQVSFSGIMRQGMERAVAFDYIRRFNISGGRLDLRADSLSAGNQQKLLLARLFYSDCKILILDEPTKNIDFATKNEIYSLLNYYVCSGNSVLMLSSDIDELIGMCDRILLLRNHTVAKTLYPKEFSYDALLRD